MLPDFLFTSYRRYKHDTDYITTWLATTAEQRGFVTEQHKPQTPTEKPTILKGRARTLARRAAQATTPSATLEKPGMSKTHPTYTIAVKDFLSMAEHIASNTQQSIKIPRKVRRLLDRAISLRRKVSKAIANQQWSTTARTQPDVESDSRHMYFVEVLEAVRQTFAHLVTDTKAPQVVDQEEGFGGDITNIFERLQVQDHTVSEPDDDHFSPEKVDTMPAGDKPESSFTAENTTDSVEASVAFLCLLNDLAQMREVISACWSEYQTGTCDLTTAALTTNTAFELARHMEEDLNKSLGHLDVEVLLKTQQTLSCQRLITSSQSSGPDDDTNDALPGVSFWSTYKHLRYFLDVGRTQTILNSTPKDAFPETNRSKLTEEDKFMQDRLLLTDMLSDLDGYADADGTDGTAAPDDELTKAFINFFSAKKVPVWLVFAAQVFLDTHHNLGENCSTGFEQVLKAGHSISWSMSDQADHQENINEPVPYFGDAFKTLANMVHAICAGPFPDPQHVGPTKRDRLFKRHPVLSGVQLYAIKAMYRDVALTFANTVPPSILASAHLYNALRMEGYVRAQWPDMDFILATQDESNLYAGALPSASDGFHTRYSLAVMGLSATNFARNRRRPEEVVYTPKGGRHLQKRTPVSDAFYVQYCLGLDRKNLAVQDIKDLLEACKVDLTNVPQVDNTVNDDTAARKSPSAASRKATNSRAVTPHKISPADVLRNLRASLDAESQALSVDYLAMHQVCTKLLASIRKAVAESMKELFRPVPEQDWGLPVMIWYILSAFAAEKTPSKQNLLPSRRDGYKGVGESLMRTAADKLNKMVNKKCEDRKDTNGNELTWGNAVATQAKGLAHCGIRCRCKVH
ncbi:hypothetical protein H2200_011044 [Cladophialophora chaetospira]|uniref:DUF6604 domain-containing protein n=1 Tax=Cladophialophora chaetospira TaxID=386627 RepID=A0AA38WZW2_9EURO|nr:hypothetical protein H2200_011044 [Cladophialophora chaetospira]